MPPVAIHVYMKLFLFDQPSDVESQPKQTEDVFEDKLQSDIFGTPPSQSKYMYIHTCMYASFNAHHIFPYHYTNLTVVCLSVCLSVCESVTGRSTEAIRPARKSLVSLHRWTWTLHQEAH